MALSFLKEKNVKNLQEIKFKNNLQANELEYHFFINLLKPILDLDVNDKLAIDCAYQSSQEIPFKLCLDKYTIIQSFKRWYYKQKREDIFSKLDIVFEQYNKLLINIKYNYTLNQLLTKKIYINIIELNSILITKLNILKTTYNDMIVNEHIDKYTKMLLI